MFLEVGPEGPSRRRKARPVEIYLPIAGIPVNIFVVFAMGLAVGFISGMFGIGGGFLMPPLLIFLGIGPAVAVATVSSHIAASSFSGVLTYWRRRALDLQLAAKGGDADAAKKRDEIASMLDAKTLAAARQNVDGWVADQQPTEAVTVPAPAGGWDQAEPAPPPKRKPPTRANAAPTARAI